MLAVGRGLHIVHHLVVDGVGAAGDGTVQTAAAAHRVKVLQLITGLGDSVQDGGLAVVRLVDDPLELIQLFGGVVNAQLEKLLVFIEHGDFGAGGAGVDDKDLHMGVPSLSLTVSNTSSKISPNHLMNYSQYGTFHRVCQRRFPVVSDALKNIGVVNKKRRYLVVKSTKYLPVILRFPSPQQDLRHGDEDGGLADHAGLVDFHV